MSYDANQPADNAELRNGPSLIRNNFQAIEDGDSSFKNKIINLTEQGFNPAILTDAFRLFSKEVSGVTELFGLADDGGSGVAYQLTGNYTAAAKGHIILLDKILINWGQEPAGTSIPVTFNAGNIAYSTNNYQLTVCPLDGPSTPIFRCARSGVGTGFTITSSVSSAFSYITIGVK